MGVIIRRICWPSGELNVRIRSAGVSDRRGDIDAWQAAQLPEDLSTLSPISWGFAEKRTSPALLSILRTKTPFCCPTVCKMPSMACTSFLIMLCLMLRRRVSLTWRVLSLAPSIISSRRERMVKKAASSTAIRAMRPALIPNLKTKLR